MVHVVGRRHVAKLRPAGLALAVVLPLASPPAPPPAARAGAAAPPHAAGALLLRWLFFAEAEHVVGLYYGRR